MGVGTSYSLRASTDRLLAVLCATEVAWEGRRGDGCAEREVEGAKDEMPLLGEEGSPRSKARLFRKGDR